MIKKIIIIFALINSLGFSHKKPIDSNTSLDFSDSAIIDFPVNLKLNNHEINEKLIEQLEAPFENFKELRKKSIRLPLQRKYYALYELIRRFPESKVKLVLRTSEEIDAEYKWHQSGGIIKLAQDFRAEGKTPEEAQKLAEEIYNDLFGEGLEERNFQAAKTQFLTWWQENKDYIEYYGNNQYRIIPLEEREPKQQEISPEAKDSKINLNLLAKNTPQQPKPQEEDQTIETTNSEKQTPTWLIYALAALGLIVLLLVIKKLKNKE